MKKDYSPVFMPEPNTRDRLQCYLAFIAERKVDVPNQKEKRPMEFEELPQPIAKLEHYYYNLCLKMLRDKQEMQELRELVDTLTKEVNDLKTGNVNSTDNVIAAVPKDDYLEYLKGKKFSELRAMARKKQLDITGIKKSVDLIDLLMKNR